MTPDLSRRNFFRYVPGTFLLITAARNVAALRAPQQSPQNPPTGGVQPPHPMGGGNGGSGGIGPGPGPGPAQHGGDYTMPTIVGPHDRRQDEKDPAPHRPRKNLVDDQKTLRDEVLRLVSDTRELNKAVAQFGPRQALSAEMVGKTKEIEKLAHDIAELAKG
jgi:hypothetical protein